MEYEPLADDNELKCNTKTFSKNRGSLRSPVWRWDSWEKQRWSHLSTRT